MKRGEIWWAQLPEPAGSEPGYRRPVLVVQDDAFNASRVATVIVAAMTSNLRLADAPGNVRVPKRDSGLPKASVVNVSQIATIPKASLAEPVGRLPDRHLADVDAGLGLVLGLRRNTEP